MRGVAVPLAWALIAGFGALARVQRMTGARTLLLSAARTACRPVRGRAACRAELVAAFATAYRFRPFSLTCLPRALALHRLLTLHGSVARVRLGLAGGRRSLEGHAWVECGGVPVAESEALVTRFSACETS